MRIYPSLLLTMAVVWTGSLPASAAPGLASGLIKRELFLNIPGTAVTDLTSNPRFTNSEPDSVSLLGSFEAPANVGSDYGERLSGWVMPPQTGNYIFFIASDDQSELWLSTDDKPTNKQMIASVPEWTNPEEWGKFPDTQNNAAAPVRLETGKSYYIEALMKQGGGGDNLAVGWVLPGQDVDPNNPPDGLANVHVIAGQYLRAEVDVTNDTMMVTSQPLPATAAVTIPDGAANPSPDTGTEFGGSGVRRAAPDQTFVIYNLGQANLDLKGNPKVAISGPQASDFTVTAQPTSPVPPGGSSTFTIHFVPSAAGLRQATVSIARGDNPANPFEFTIQGTGLGSGAGVLGNDSEGVTWAPVGDSQIHGNRFQSPRDMQIKELHAKLVEMTGTMKCAVYSDTNGLADHLLHGSVDVVNPTNGWNAFALTAPVNVNAGQYYWLVIWSDSTEARVQYDSTGSSAWGSYPYADLAGQWPDPISLAGGQNTRTYCIYGEGTPAGTVAGPAVDIRSNNKLVVSGDTTPSLLDGTDFGSVGVGSGAKDQTFTIENPGDTALALSANPPVTVTGAHASDFTVTAQPPASVPAGGTAKFTVRFKPTVRGLRTATISIPNNNPGDNPYQFAVQGAGYLTGRESIWPDTKTGKQWVENTDYELGMIFQSSVPGKVTHIRVYSVVGERGDHTARLWRNADDMVMGGPYTWNYGGFTGWITLDIPDVDIEANTEYTVTVSTGDQVKNYPNIAADVAKGGNNEQHLSYPNNAGVFSTSLGTRPTQSYNGGNYLRDIVFVPAGASVDLPNIEVRANSLSVTNGDLTPSVGDGTDFGQTGTGATIDHSFAISNTGAAPLNFTGASQVSIGGANASDFKVVAQPSSPVAAGSSTSFILRFAPTQAGARNAIVSIENDSDQNPFTFAITGVGVAAAPRPKILEVKPDLVSGSVTVRWETQGQQFQVEKATDVTGPWTPVGSKQSAVSFTDAGALKANARSFYRVQVVTP